MREVSSRGAHQCSEVRFGRSLCGDLSAAEAREWLLTNGRGGYAMGTVAGTLTRRYHGLLIAAVDPPATRRLVVARLDLDVDYGGTAYALSTNRWRSGISLLNSCPYSCSIFCISARRSSWVLVPECCSIDASLGRQ